MSLLLILGDSITWGAWDPAGGWVQRLRGFLDTKKDEMGNQVHTVYNLGINGNTSEDLLRRLDFEVQQRFDEDRDVLLIFAIGVNDSQFLLNENNVKMTVEQYEFNLENIFNKAQRYTKNIVFVGLLPVVDEKVNPVSWNAHIAYQNNRIRSFNEALQIFCKSHAIYYINIWDNWLKEDYSSMLEDGIHPNETGHKEIFICVKDYLFENDLIHVP